MLLPSASGNRTKAMAMGRRARLLPPEQADSWGEFHARLELEAAAMGPWTTPLWWCLAAVLFVAGLISCDYALQDRRWWLWVVMLAALAIDGVMAARAVDRADKRRARAMELHRLHDAWLEHLERCSRTR
jgi:hypothetical protein